MRNFFTAFWVGPQPELKLTAFSLWNSHNHRVFYTLPRGLIPPTFVQHLLLPLLITPSPSIAHRVCCSAFVNYDLCGLSSTDPAFELDTPLAIKYWPQTTVSWLSLYDLANLQTLHRLNCKQKHDYDLRFDRSLLRCDWVERVAVVDAMSWVERFALPAHWRRLTSLWEMLASQCLEDNFIQCCFLVSGPGDYVLVIRWDVAAQNWRRFLWLQTTHTQSTCITLKP